jgi:hypothetical protein
VGIIGGADLGHRAKTRRKAAFSPACVELLLDRANPGIAHSHTADGLTRHVRYQPRDTKHLTFRKGEGMTHDLENVGDNDLVFVTVEFV